MRSPYEEKGEKYWTTIQPWVFACLTATSPTQSNKTPDAGQIWYEHEEDQ
jgi:hypothetical protein